VARRSAEERLLDRCFTLDRNDNKWEQHERAIRRLLREIKRECAERAVAAYNADRTVMEANPQRALAIRAAIMGGKRRG